MEVRGKLEAVNKLDDGRTIFALSTQDGSAGAELAKLTDHDLKVSVVRYRNKKTANANAMLWHCIHEIASALELDTETVYIDALRTHGVTTEILVPPVTANMVMSQLKYCKIVGESQFEDCWAYRVQVYIGSSAYNTEEMSRLIDGVIDEMKELDLPLPIPADVQAALEQWEGDNNQL